MKIKTLLRWTLLKSHRDSRILHSRTAKKLADSENKKNFEVQPSQSQWIWIFGALISLGHHSETHAKLVMKLFEAVSWFCWTREEAILTLHCCSKWLHSMYLWLVACDLHSTLYRMNRLQLSIGEWRRDHEETVLVFFRSWLRYFWFHVSSCVFR